jgi:hypothetical protein
MPTTASGFVLPATGSEIVMGRVRKAFSNITPAAGQNVSLSGTLGSYMGQSSGTQISLSSRFGGQTTPYSY